MKVFWNDLRLKFKEQLRVVGKYDLNRADDYLVKRRKFKDVDITKDFERRLTEKNIKKMQEEIENKNYDINEMSLNELEVYRDKIQSQESEEKKSDLFQKVVLRDIQ